MIAQAYYAYMAEAFTVITGTGGGSIQDLY